MFLHSAPGTHVHVLCYVITQRLAPICAVLCYHTVPGTHVCCVMLSHSAWHPCVLCYVITQRLAPILLCELNTKQHKQYTMEEDG